MSLTTYNLLLVKKNHMRNTHTLLMSHVSLCLLEVVFRDNETLETAAGGWQAPRLGISPGTNKFFCKNAFHTKATPFYETEPFLDRFLSEGASGASFE